MLETLLVVFHVLLAVALIGLILLQHGKGADAGAAFGSGASATVFGARGAASFLSRATAVLATLFFVTSLVLAYFAMQAADRPGLVTKTPAPAAAVQPPVEVPAAVVPPAPRPASEVPEAPPGK